MPPPGNPSMEGMAALLRDLNAGPLGRATVILFDLREETILYVNGRPYIHRHAERPTTSWHHAGVRPPHLEHMERQLVGDAQQEVARWEGHLLLHQEGTLGRSTNDITHLNDSGALPSTIRAWWAKVRTGDSREGVAACCIGRALLRDVAGYPSPRHHHLAPSCGVVAGWMQRKGTESTGCN